MKVLIVVSSLVIPLLMVIFQRKRKKFQMIVNGLAILSALIFGNIASIAIYEMIRNNTVFMTNIHGLFLNPLFLITGAYLGLYLIYILALNLVNKE